MKILVIGAHGTIGNKIVAALGHEHQIIKAGRNSGEVKVDISDSASIKAMFEKVGKVDAVVNASGDVAFAPFSDLNQDHWEIGIRSKFMGQVNLVTIGKDYVNDGGSFTLTSGVLSHSFIPTGTSATAIGRAIEGFAQASSNVIGRGIRINVVSPTLLVESEQAYGPYFPGFIAVPGEKVAQFYKRSVLGTETGRVFDVEA